MNGMENTFNNGIRVMSGLMGSSAVSAAPLPPSSGRSRALCGVLLWCMGEGSLVATVVASDWT